MIGGFPLPTARSGRRAGGPFFLAHLRSGFDPDDRWIGGVRDRERRIDKDAKCVHRQPSVARASVHKVESVVKVDCKP